MVEYIERESAQKKIKELCNDYNVSYGERFGGFAEHISKFAKQVPVADVAKVKHGKWIESYTVGYSGTKYFQDNCSVCGCVAISADSEKYCHNCGAKMDLGCQSEAE